jgi:high affinity cGMP-specific 3',5'-cyclic phosphodiesterase 9
MFALLAAMCHDLDHPGFNNSFLVSTRDEIALLYNHLYQINDQSVLGNQHLAQTFLLLRQKDLDIFGNLGLLEYKKAREIIIKMVLSTDMSFH